MDLDVYVGCTNVSVQQIGHSPEDDDDDERSSSSSDDGNETDDTECINDLEEEIITDDFYFGICDYGIV